MTDCRCHTVWKTKFDEDKNHPYSLDETWSACECVYVSVYLKTVFCFVFSQKKPKVSLLLKKGRKTSVRFIYVLCCCKSNVWSAESFQIPLLKLKPKISSQKVTLYVRHIYSFIWILPDINWEKMSTVWRGSIKGSFWQPSVIPGDECGIL